MIQDQYSGHIIVRLAQERRLLEDVEVADLKALAEKHGLRDLAALLRQNDQCQSTRLVSAVDARRSLELEAKAFQGETSPPRSLASYWRIDAQAISPADQDRIIAALNDLPMVDLAYRELRGRNPEAPGPSRNPFLEHQFHLFPAPFGIDAFFAHGLPAGRGERAGFIDLEQGWFFDHEDVPAILEVEGISTESVQRSKHHGTAVLGVAVGRDNDRGILGVAPEAARVAVTSHVRGGRPDQIVDAIFAVLDRAEEFEAGDVLLIEWQDARNRPAEASPAIRDAIQTACLLGFVVVEAAGNANLDLDQVPELTPGNRAFEDSKAIVVGACHSRLSPDRASHNRWLHPLFPAGSNFGSRVDCHAAGEDVVTAGPSRFPGQSLGNGLDHRTQYRRDFGGTSAAAAIVAGAAVAVQSMVKEAGRPPLSSEEMRELFRNHGTPQGPVAGHIGVMPDLRQIVAELKLPTN